MDLRIKAISLIKVLRQYPKRVVIGLVILFILNWILFFLMAAYSPSSPVPGIPLFLAIFVIPILFIIFGIDQLQRWENDDKTELKRRRATTLRYFSVVTLLLLATLVSFWRYVADVSVIFPSNSFFYLTIIIIILSGLFVTTIWYLIKFSENKLSVYINKAPHNYLFSFIAFVTAFICYIASSDIENTINYAIVSRSRDTLDYSSRVISTSDLRWTKALFQYGMWISTFLGIGNAVLGYLRPTENQVFVNNLTKDNKKKENSIQIELPNENESPELTLLTPENYNLEALVAKVESNNSKLEALLNQLLSLPLKADGILPERIELIRGRLTEELKALTKRGNLNLAIGVATTIAAIFALYWGLIATQPLPSETEIVGVLRHYIPRVSFAIFIEVFSFFFLRLYKNSLEDIKYYHNELTNLDSKLLALEIASSSQLPEALTPILLGLLNTDRNFILKSGESTVELEKVKTEQQYIRALLDTISAKIPDMNIIKKDSK